MVVTRYVNTASDDESSWLLPESANEDPDSSAADWRNITPIKSAACDGSMILLVRDGQVIGNTQNTCPPTSQPFIWLS